MRSIAAIAGLALLFAAARARAESPLVDPYDLPDAPRPLSLPELTHPEVEWTTTTAIGAISGQGRTSDAITERLAVEAPIGPRRWFVGFAYEGGVASPRASDGAAGIVGGNAELYGRTVWATRTGLAFGGGLGAFAPLATFAREGAGADRAAVASALQPWDEPFFRAGLLNVRPFIDVRDLFGRFVVQLRESIDWGIGLASAQDTGFSASSALYLGWTVTNLVGVGVEATEYYRIDAPIPDDRRAAFVVMPHVRVLGRLVQPALGAFAGFGAPLTADADSVWGLRLAISFVWDPQPRATN